MSDYLSSDDIEKLLHARTVDQTISLIVADTLKCWDTVKKNLDVVKSVLTEVVNAIIREQNKIHSRIEQKRPWANARHEIIKFEYLGDKFKVFLMDNREVITGEKQPLKTLEVDTNLVVNSHLSSVFTEYFKKYEANLQDKYIITKKTLEENQKFMRRQDWEKAKEFYQTYKDEFEVQANKADPITPLSFADWFWEDFCYL